VRPDGSVEDAERAASGKNDVALKCPKRMAITGDTLWVTDTSPNGFLLAGFFRASGPPP